MKMHSAVLASVLAAAGCASTSMPGGLKAGEFVSFTCEGGKRYSARASADAKTVRLRHEGGWELERKAEGVYEADGWRLSTGGSGGSEVVHNGKVVLKGCKPG